MIVLPFEPDHLDRLMLQPSQAYLQPQLADRNYGKWLVQGGSAFSAAVDGEIIASLGVLPQWENRAIAWGLIGSEARHHLLAIHKAVRRFLELTPYRRIETSVVTDFAEGHRWATLLGFEREGTMKAYTPGGIDCDLYARVR